MHLNVSVLGPLQVWLDGKRINQFEFERVRALLVYIFVEADTQHDRAALATMLWPDASLKTGLQNLRQTLAALKRALKEKQQATPFLLTTANTISVNPDSDYSLDIHFFADLIKQTEVHSHRRLSVCSVCMDRLEQISQIYRGDFASDIRVDSQSFEEWQLFKQEQAHIQAMRALARLTDYYLRHNRLAKALQKARQQLALYSLCEIGHHQLIQALAVDGRRHAALKHCEAYKALLVEELMIPLPAKTAVLYDKLVSETWDPVSICPPPQHNLPKPITPFVGYEAELALIHECLSKAENRFITLTGIVGSGKSRTAIEAAWKEIPNFRDGVYYLDLEEVRPHQLLSALAELFLPSISAEEHLVNQLTGCLRDKEILLVLDHFDHLIASDASIIRMLLREVPGAYILLTSQALLRLQGEKYLEMKGLEFAADVEVDSFFSSSAIRFFIQSVNIWQPDFNLETAEDRKAVLRVCQYSNGNPRALELFAYGINFIPLNHVSPDIQNVTMPGELLSRDVPQRQRSLQDMFTSSWRSLANEEKDQLISLSVFGSTFNLIAAQGVAQASPAMLLTLHAKSWLQLHCPPRLQAGKLRECDQYSLAWSYQIPRLFHAFIGQRLKQNPARWQSLQMAHALFYMNFLRQHMDNLLSGSDQAWIMNAVRHELENIQQAWNWAMENRLSDLVNQIEHDMSLYYIIENRRQRYENGAITLPQFGFVPPSGHDAVVYRSVGIGN
jgi:DNA-binding SARP family transcriptional activator/predicted ATPase